MNELNFYNNDKDWDFSKIKYISEVLTNWDIYDLLKENVKEESRILDLGTGGGEKLLSNFPNAKEIIGTDFSEEMIKTANRNLQLSGRKNITFKIMDNLNMSTPKNYFDIVVAYNTCIDARQIYETLNDKGILLVHGVDKLDCWDLKRMFGFGQGYKDINPISLIDYEQILNAGFEDVELVPIHVREYYQTKEDFLALINKTPILNDFSEENFTSNKVEIDGNIFNEYIENNITEKGILLKRRYYGIVAQKKGRN